MASCFPLLSFFGGYFQGDKLTQTPSSAFVYCKSWEFEDDEELTAQSSVSSNSSSEHGIESKLQQFDFLADISKTHYPEFEIDFCTETTDDEYETEDEKDYLEEKYRTKEDEDVAVFLKLIERLPLKSILHLLQGHARSQNICFEQYSGIAQANHDHQRRNQKPLSKPAKKFRWAEITDNQVRTIVHEVDSWKDLKDLWLNTDEANEIKREFFETIRFVQVYHHDHIETLNQMLKADTPESDIEKCMMKITKASYSRGLESSLLCTSGVKQQRKKHVRKILNTQVKCRRREDDFNITSENLRKDSLESSKTLRIYAGRMGRCDELEALALASSCRWE